MAKWQAIAGGLVGVCLSMAAMAADTANFTLFSGAGDEYSLDGKKWLPASVVTNPYPIWLPINHASYIWTAAQISKEEAVNGSPIVTFRKIFTVRGAGGQATLRITADNAYEASLNGVVLGSNGALEANSSNTQQWRSLDTYSVALKPGQNELRIRAINYRGDPAATYKTNPAGVIFSLVVTPPLAQTLASSGAVDVYGVLFDTDKAELKPESNAALDQAAKLLRDDPALKLEVGGHTDNTGGNAHNMELSQRRAATVVAALEKDYGIAPDRLAAKGYGDTKPVAPNDTEEGRSKNRRVELRKE